MSNTKEDIESKEKNTVVEEEGHIKIEKMAAEALKKELAEESAEESAVVDMNVPGKTVTKSSSDMIRSANNIMLLEVLSPQVEQNENNKRKHKSVLIFILAVFLIAQFIMTFFIIHYSFGFIFRVYEANQTIDNHLVNLLFTFIMGYITSVVVELIYMLKFIVQNVFDTSISDLVKLFKEETKKK